MRKLVDEFVGNKPKMTAKIVPAQQATALERSDQRLTLQFADRLDD